MRRVAWIVACVLLFMSVLGLTMHTQSLESEIKALEKQLVASKRPEQSTCKVRGDWLPNTTTTGTVNGRQYLVHVPENFVSYEYYPLIMFYPGKGASAGAAQATFGLDKLPAIVVYPYPTANTEGVLAWQGAPYSSPSDDVAFTAAVLDRLQDDLCVDRTKVYAAGFSNGGGFAALLSCKLPERFAAYAVIAGAMYAPAGQCVPSKPAPLISIHGDKDSIVPYDGSLLRKLPSIDSWTASRAKLNGCATPTTVNEGINSIVTIWNQCTDNATVQNVRIQGGGHSWGQITNQALWQFLSRFSL